MSLSYIIVKFGKKIPRLFPYLGIILYFCCIKFHV